MNDMTQGTALATTPQQRAAAALGAADHEVALLALAGKHAGITEIKSPAAREDCHSAYMEVKTTRVAIEKTGKTAREDAQAFAKAVIAEANRLVSIITKEEERLRKIRDDYDEAQEKERLAGVEAEKSRVNALLLRVDGIRSIPARCVAKTAVELAAAIDELTQMEITEGTFAEFFAEAMEARRTSLAQLSVMHSGAEARDQLAKRASEERAELERLRAENAERARQEEAVRAEAERARVAEEQAVLKRQQEAIAANQAILEKQTKDMLAESERLETLARERQADADRRLAAEREELEAARHAHFAKVQADIDARAQVDTKVQAGAQIFYNALLQLRATLAIGSPDAEIVEKALSDAGLER